MKHAAHTSLLVKSIEELQQLWLHVPNGLEEGLHGCVIGDAAPTSVVAAHAVTEGGHRIT